MTGLSGRELVERSFHAAQICPAGIELLDPVASEGVSADKPVVRATAEELQEFWRRDKEMIREAHVLIDLTGGAKSEGVAHEIGYARFFLWKPVIRVYPGLGTSIAAIEGDFVADSLASAYQLALRYWGTGWQRATWRLRLYVRCRLKAFWYELKEWVNAVQ